MANKEQASRSSTPTMVLEANGYAQAAAGRRTEAWSLLVQPSLGDSYGRLWSTRATTVSVAGDPSRPEFGQVGYDSPALQQTFLPALGAASLLDIGVAIIDLLGLILGAIQFGSEVSDARRAERDALLDLALEMEALELSAGQWSDRPADYWPRLEQFSSTKAYTTLEWGKAADWLGSAGLADDQVFNWLDTIGDWAASAPGRGGPAMAGLAQKLASGLTGGLTEPLVSDLAGLGLPIQEVLRRARMSPTAMPPEQVGKALQDTLTLFGSQHSGALEGLGGTLAFAHDKLEDLQMLAEGERARGFAEGAKPLLEGYGSRTEVYEAYLKNERLEGLFEGRRFSSPEWSDYRPYVPDYRYWGPSPGDDRKVMPRLMPTVWTGVPGSMASLTGPTTPADVTFQCDFSGMIGQVQILATGEAEFDKVAKDIAAVIAAELRRCLLSGAGGGITQSA